MSEGDVRYKQCSHPDIVYFSNKPGRQAVSQSLDRVVIDLVRMSLSLSLSLSLLSGDNYLFNKGVKKAEEKQLCSSVG